MVQGKIEKIKDIHVGEREGGGYRERMLGRGKVTYMYMHNVREKEKEKMEGGHFTGRKLHPKWKEKKIGNVMFRKATKVHVYAQYFKPVLRSLRGLI